MTRHLFSVGILFIFVASAVSAGTFPLYQADGSNATVFKFDSAGNASVFANAGDGLTFPSGIAVDATGNVYVAEVNNGLLWKFDPAGNGVIFADGTDGLSDSYGVAVGPSGNVYVGNYFAGGNVIRFTAPHTGSVFAAAEVFKPSRRSLFSLYAAAIRKPPKSTLNATFQAS